VTLAEVESEKEFISSGIVLVVATIHDFSSVCKHDCSTLGSIVGELHKDLYSRITSLGIRPSELAAERKFREFCLHPDHETIAVKAYTSRTRSSL
jgi:hypothetical protein